MPEAAADGLESYHVTSGSMTPQRALEIVSAINDRCMFTMELCDNPKSLAGVSLAEMIEAKGIIEAQNDAAESVNGSRTIKLIPDDRLIAAAYCMEHYEPSNEAIVVMPMTKREGFWHETKRKALAVLPLKDGEVGDEDDDA